MDAVDRMYLAQYLRVLAQVPKPIPPQSDDDVVDDNQPASAPTRDEE